MGSQSSKDESHWAPPHVGEDQLMDLLYGLLPEEEKKGILGHLSACAQCENLLRGMVAERERLRATRVLRKLPSGDLIVERASEAGGARQGEERPWSRISRAWARFLDGLRQPRFQWVGGAVVAVAVLLIVLYPRMTEPPAGAGLYLLPAALDETMLRAVEEGTPGRAELAAGIAAYGEADFHRAVGLLDTSEVLGPLKTVRDVYLGSALAKEGRYDRAVEVLKNVPARTLPDPWGLEAAWTLYVSLKKSGREASADSLLRLLAVEAGEMGERARSEIGN